MGTWLAFAVVLSAINTGMQLLDLHTTIEVIKTGKGQETNGLLHGWLNDPALPIGARFWRLAAVKCAAILAVWFPTLFQGWCVATGRPILLFAFSAPWLPTLALAGLAAYYLPILRENWRIYKS